MLIDFVIFWYFGQQHARHGGKVTERASELSQHTLLPRDESVENWHGRSGVRFREERCTTLWPLKLLEPSNLRLAYISLSRAQWRCPHEYGGEFTSAPRCFIAEFLPSPSSLLTVCIRNAHTLFWPAARATCEEQSNIWAGESL